MFPKFEIFNEVFYTYPLILGAIWAVGYEYSRSLNQNLKNYSWLFLTVFIAAWLGAKGLFLFTLDTERANQFSQTANFWLGGGFVFLGGLIAGLLVIAAHKSFFNQKIILVVF